VTALRHAGMSGHDIAALLAERALQATPQRPLLIPNEEIATYGLNRRPDVLAGEWTEGNDVFTCCRACIEQKPQPYQAQIDGASAAIYDGTGSATSAAATSPKR
jgi:hypothetical protein